MAERPSLVIGGKGELRGQGRFRKDVLKESYQD